MDHVLAHLDREVAPDRARHGLERVGGADDLAGGGDRGLALEHERDERAGGDEAHELVEFITSAPLVALVLEGHEAVTAARQVIGATNPLEASPGSIRGDYALEVGQNMVHGSDSNESAEREAKLFFPELD